MTVSELRDLSLQVPVTGSQHLGLQDSTTDDVTQVVHASAKDDSLGSQTGRSNLRYHGVDDWSNGHGVDTQPHDAKDGLAPSETQGLVRQRQETNKPEKDDQCAESREPDSPAPKLVDVEPGNHGADERETFTAEGDVVCNVVCDAGLLEEKASTVAERTAICNVREESHARNLCSAKVRAPESIPVRGTGTLLHLQLVGSQVSTDSHWHDLGGVGRTSGCEHTPGNVGEDLTHEDDLYGGGKEYDEDEARQGEQADYEYLAVAPSRGSPAVENGTENVHHGSEGIESLLPGGGNLVSALFVEPFAVLLSKLGVAVEGTEERHVVPFHDDGQRDHCGDQTEGKAMLLCVTLKGFSIEPLVVQVNILKTVEISLSTLDLSASLGVVSHFAFYSKNCQCWRIELQGRAVERIFRRAR
ncbi:unnamed protein product [Clonostachys chloroleuca]|uniref:Uncharacterized protein n=1 Tax=Clonostachys chloroleuca TaxID=1926264 RepID=A0AA35MB42_9HYPO|nr:unnamed protein product [Clonostachys chloroleuca]